MPEYITLGLSTESTKAKFRKVLEQHRSLSSTIVSLLNRDTTLRWKHRFQSLAGCHVWVEEIIAGCDSMSTLTPILQMLDTYVNFNRLDSRAAALEELLFVVEENQRCRDDVTESTGHRIQEKPQMTDKYVQTLPLLSGPHKQSPGEIAISSVLSLDNQENMTQANDCISTNANQQSQNCLPGLPMLTRMSSMNDGVLPNAQHRTVHIRPQANVYPSYFCPSGQRPSPAMVYAYRRPMATFNQQRHMQMSMQKQVVPCGNGWPLRRFVSNEPMIMEGDIRSRPSVTDQAFVKEPVSVKAEALSPPTTSSWVSNQNLMTERNNSMKGRKRRKSISASELTR